MALTAEQCKKFSSFLFRRTPNWDAELAKDRFPYEFIYSNMYSQRPWKSFTGDTHTWDKVHVARPNDDGCWDRIDIGACLTNVCDPSRKFLGWGSTRANYGKYHRDYSTPVLCLDQLKDTEEAVAQLNAIVAGLKEVPDDIVSNFLRTLALRQSDKIYIVNAAGSSVTVTDSMFLANCSKIDLGGTGNLPTGKLTMNYLDSHVEELGYQGYHNKSNVPGAKFTITMDATTRRSLLVQNPELRAMYSSADFAKGGQYYSFGVTAGAGDWLFKIDPDQLRFQHIGNGVLQRIWPYENVAATVGIRPEFSAAYSNAEYVAYHVYNTEARIVYAGEVPSVNSDMKFDTSRNLMGRWSWKSPDAFEAFDPTTGSVCVHYNDKKNKGYFLGEYEFGVKTVNPKIERWILAKREPVQFGVEAPCRTSPAMVYQSLLPYNVHCDPSGGEE